MAHPAPPPPLPPAVARLAPIHADVVTARRTLWRLAAELYAPLPVAHVAVVVGLDGGRQAVLPGLPAAGPPGGGVGWPPGVEDVRAVARAFAQCAYPDARYAAVTVEFADDSAAACIDAGLAASPASPA